MLEAPNGFSYSRGHFKLVPYVGNPPLLARNFIKKNLILKYLNNI